jgi:hypothetical protein
MRAPAALNTNAADAPKGRIVGARQDLMAFARSDEKGK